ncbi:MAG: acyl carrier protein [Acutalibacteraceae bacterium]|nr:acyl carrier protein [Acutalibacteraceae bacterium]HIR03406.1 acyl carrier protein [Candidatus Scatovicinus merdipullorum]
MNLQDIEMKIRELLVLSLHLDKPPAEIAGTDLITELSINSIDALEIFLNLENTFGFQIPDEDLGAELLQSLPYCCEYIYNKVSGIG